MNNRFARWTLPVAGGVLLLVLWWSGGRNPPPDQPSDPPHGFVDNAACVPCHDPGAPNPLAEGHPPKENCIYCHRSAVR